MRIVVALAVVAATALPARAQPNTNTRADQLFREGRAALEAGDFASACTRFEESQRLDPGVGTLLNLGLCYEGMGKLATAVDRFRQAEADARKRGDARRATAATEKIRALTPRVPTLTVVLQGVMPPDVRVTIDGVAVALGDLGRPRPMDPGSVRIEVGASGHRPYDRVITLVEGERRRHDVPALERNPDAPVQQSVPIVNHPPASSRPGRTQRIASLALGSAGVVALTTSVVLGISANGTYDSAFEDRLCTKPDLTCNDEGQKRTDRARQRGTIATVIGGAGLAMIAGGAILWLTAPDRERPGAPHAQLTPLVGPDLAGVALGGSF